MILTPEQLLKFNVTPEMIELGVTFNDVDLICSDFQSYEKHKVKYAISLFDIFGLGGKAYSEIAKLITKPEELFTLGSDESKIAILKSTMGPAKTKTLVDGLNKINSEGIELWKLIMCLMVDNCGRTISKQFAKYYSCEILGNKVTYSFDGLQKSVIDELKTITYRIDEIISDLQSKGFVIQYPENDKILSADTIFYVMTGSPKEFGYKTKSEFSAKFPSNWVEHKALSAETHYLITDDLTSKSSKMKKAEKLNTQVVLYTNEMFNF